MYLWDFKANYVETVESRVADMALVLHTSSLKTPMLCPLHLWALLTTRNRVSNLQL